MFRHLLLGSSAAMLLYWLSQVRTTTSVWIGVVMPIVAVILGFVWVFLQAAERIAANARALTLGAEELELLKKAVREKKAREAAAAGQGQPGAPAPVAGTTPPRPPQ